MNNIFRHYPGNKQATRPIISNIISYNPISVLLISYMERELGVNITYSKASRAREDAFEQNNDRCGEDANKSLPQYCLDIERIPTAKPSSTVLPTTNFFACFHVTAPNWLFTLQTNP